MLATPKCFERRCKHLTGAYQPNGELGERCACKAFPKGIPDEIAYGDNKHLTPYPGDHGIQYEPDETQEVEQSTPGKYSVPDLDDYD